MATDVMFVPAALASTVPMYVRMTDVPAGMGLRLMPETSLGESDCALPLPGVPNVRLPTPADSVVCAAVIASGHCQRLP